MQPQEILPSPSAENNIEKHEAIDPSYNEKEGSKKIELDSTTPKSSQGSTALAGVVINDAQSVLGSIQPVASSQQSALSDDDDDIDVPSDAQDLDLIEKEWVLKAKKIVAQTEGDPHKQNEQLSKMKVTYIKKRYSKELKQSEVKK